MVNSKNSGIGIKKDTSEGANQNQINNTMTAEEMQVYNKLSHKPITRGKLCSLLHIDDRAVRKNIESMRRKGIPICSSSESAGYFLARSRADVERTANEYKKRAIKELEIAKKLLSYKLDNQTEIDYGG